MASARPTRRSGAAPLFGYDVFISFALGPPPRGSRAYASDLAGKLRERDFTVFFSEDEAPAGAQLDETLKRALQRSRLLVVLANRGTLAEPRWVRSEVAEFRRIHPRRSVIPISFDGALTDAVLGPKVEEWLPYRDRIWIDESAQAESSGVVSESVLERLATAPHAVRSAARLRRSLATISLVFAGLAAAAVWWAVQANQRALESEAARLAAESRGSFTQQLPGRALLLAAAAWDTAPTATALSALLAAHLHDANVVTYLPHAESYALRFASGGTLAVATGDGTLHFYGPDGAPIGSARPADAGLPFDHLVRFQESPTNDVLAVAAKGRVQLWSATSRQPLGAAVEVEGTDPTMAFNQEGTVIVIAARSGETATTVSRRSVPELRPLGQSVRISGKAMAIALDPGDGSTVVVLESGQVQRLDALDGTVTLAAEVKGPLANAVLQGAQLVAADSDGQLTHYWVGPGKAQRSRVNPLKGGPRAAPDSLTWGRRLFASYRDGSIWRWDMSRPNEPPVPFARHPAGRLETAISKDGRHLAVGGFRTVNSVYVLDRPHHLATVLPPPPMSRATAAAFAPDGRLAVGDSAGRVVLWDPVSRKELYRLPETLSTDLNRLSFSRDGARLAFASTGFDARTRVWDLQRSRWVGPEMSLEGVLSPDGTRLASTGGSTVNEVRIDAVDGTEVTKRTGPAVLPLPGPPRSLAWSPSGDRLAVSYDPGSVAIWDAADLQQPPIVLAKGGRNIGALAFTEDGKRLLAAQGPRVLVWTFGEPAVQRSFHGDSALRDVSDIETLALSPDGTFVAVLSGGGIQFWNLDSGEPVGERVALPLGILRRLHFSQDGRWLAVAGLEGFFLLSLDASNWRQLACSRAQRNLSCEEWSRYVRGARYRPLCPALASPPSC